MKSCLRALFISLVSVASYAGPSITGIGYKLLPNETTLIVSHEGRITYRAYHDNNRVQIRFFGTAMSSSLGVAELDFSSSNIYKISVRPIGKDTTDMLLMLRNLVDVGYSVSRPGELVIHITDTKSPSSRSSNLKQTPTLRNPNARAEPRINAGLGSTQETLISLAIAFVLAGCNTVLVLFLLAKRRPKLLSARRAVHHPRPITTDSQNEHLRAMREHILAYSRREPTRDIDFILEESLLHWKI